VAAKIEADMKMKMEANNRFVASNKERVIKQMMKNVYEIKPAIHQNFRLE
jgi:V-type H+-transporting ATPase subunit G